MSRNRKSRRQRGFARSLVVPEKVTDARAAQRLRLPDDLTSDEVAEAHEQRPRTRGECALVPRPCPFVSCRYNLFLEVTESGGLKLNFPDVEPWDLVESCALDVADRGGLTLEETGEIQNITRERARQVEVVALLKLKARDLEDPAEQPAGLVYPESPL